MIEHTGHEAITFDYATLAMPTPGTPFDYREMGHDDYYNYNLKTAELLFKPYNVR